MTKWEITQKCFFSQSSVFHFIFIFIFVVLVTGLRTLGMPLSYVPVNIYPNVSIL